MILISLILFKVYLRFELKFLIIIILMNFHPMHLPRNNQNSIPLSPGGDTQQ